MIVTTAPIDGTVMCTARWRRFAPSISAGLVQLRIDRRDGRQVDDGAPADLLPDVGGHQQRAEEPGGAEQVGCLLAEQAVRRRDHAPLRRQDLEQDAGQDHPRHEVRQVGDRLHGALVRLRSHLVDQQRQHDRRRESEQDAQRADDDGVAQDAAEQRRFEGQPEVLEVVPRASPGALDDLVVLEGDQHPVDRQVVEDEQRGDRKQQEQVEQAHAPGAAPALVGQQRLETGVAADAAHAPSGASRSSGLTEAHRHRAHAVRPGSGTHVVHGERRHSVHSAYHTRAVDRQS